MTETAMTVRLARSRRQPGDDVGELTLPLDPATGPCARCHAACERYGPQGAPLCRRCRDVVPESSRSAADTDTADDALTSTDCGDGRGMDATGTPPGRPK